MTPAQADALVFFCATGGLAYKKIFPALYGMALHGQLDVPVVPAPRRRRDRRLAAAFVADDIVIGGGNAKLMRRLPAGARRGDNRRAFAGGYRLWSAR